MRYLDDFALWLFRRVIPRWIHRHLPHWVKVLFNRWMRQLGDPGDRPT